MRALVCHEYGPIENLRLEEVAAPPMQPGGLRLAVGAAGVSFAALLGIAGKHQNKPGLPYVPGNEVAGTVIEVADDVSAFRPGDRVLSPTQMGAYAEQVVVPAVNAHRMPEGLDFAAATNFPTLYPTAYGALAWKARLAPGEVLLVHGAGGGSGLTAVEVGKAMGAEIIATAGGADKLAAARAHGADHLVDSRHDDVRQRVLEITGGRGADVIYDPVGGDLFDLSLRCIAPEGRLIPMGFASGRIPQIPANILLVKNATVIGFYYGFWNGWGRDGNDPAIARRRAMVAAALQEMLGWYTEGKLKAAVAGSFPLERASEAFRLIEQRTVIGKAVLDPRRGQ